MRIGIFGGAFNPIHNGHLLLAEQCREQCQLDEVWFVPTRTPPHKTADNLSSGANRLEMIRLATAGIPAFRASSIELEHNEVSWTVDTLRRVNEKRPDDELFFMIGADSLHDLPTWREPESIAQLATIVAVNRGTQSEDLDQSLQVLSESIRSRIQLVSIPGVGISSTDIRQRIEQKKSIRYQVPRAIEQYIAEHGLYAT
jgi:nicotinate-nucleotide adenylyltransferase